MAETITIVLPQEIRAALEEISEREGLSSNEIISEALKEYLFFRRLRLLRGQMIVKAQAQGITREQDVFDRVS